jgi:putative DNA primase/helicase
MPKLSSEQIQQLIDDALKGASKAKPAARNGTTNGRAASIGNDNSEPNEIDRLARLPTIEYDRQRERAAKRLGVRVGTIDKMVRKKQALAEDEAASLPHWKVEPSPEPVDGATLLDSLREVFRRYIVLPKGGDIALPLWVLHAWTMDAGEISPFMVLVSPTKRCGKTSVLILLYYLTPRSELASNITAAALFRYVEEVRPTLLVDEADSFVKNNEELRGILNSGHTRAAANVIRTVEVNGIHTPRRFSTWAPKAIATIRALADTLEDRAIVLQLQRKPPSTTIARLRRRDSEEFAAMRAQAARWTIDNFDKLTDPEPPVPGALNDRAADNWRPLLAIADIAGGTWPQEARQAACLLSGEQQDRAIGVELLKDIRATFGDDDVIRSGDLIARLTADPERPWAEWKHGRPLTQKQLAGLLAPFRIISATVHPPGLPHGKGYRRADFEEPWRAYCPGQNPLSPSTDTSEACKRANADEMGASRDFRSVREIIPHGSKNDELSHSHAGLHACTDRKPENGAKDQIDHDPGLTGRPPTAWPIKTGHRCDFCGSQFGDVSPWHWPPDYPTRTIWLHERCKAPWYDSGGAPEDVQTSAHKRTSPG